jgi:hypothetical protein
LRNSYDARIIQTPSNTPLPPASDPNDGLVIECKIYAFPSYEQAVETTDVEKYFSKQAYEKAVGDRNFELQKLKFMSDGLKVVAYLYRPKLIRSVHSKRAQPCGSMLASHRSVLPVKSFVGML